MAAKWNWLFSVLGILLLAASLPVAVCLPLAHQGQSDEMQLATLTPIEQHGGEFSIHLTLPAEQPANHTRVLSAAPLEGYPTLQEGEPVSFKITAKGDQLTVCISKPQSADLSCTVEQVAIIHRRQPDGSVHPLRHILLSCAQGEGEAQKIWQQQVELDLAARTADPAPCAPPAPHLAALARQDYQSAAPCDLPEKHRGSPLQRRLSMLVHAVAAVDSPELAAAAPELLAYAWQLARMAPEPRLPWPANWGDHEADARAAAEAITPTLIYLQERNCFDNGDLAAFINSPAFGVIFGDRFTARSTERLQEQPIEFISLPAPHADEP